MYQSKNQSKHQKIITTRIDTASISYLTKMVRIEKHPHYKPEMDAGKMTEKEMVSSGGFNDK